MILLSKNVTVAFIRYYIYVSMPYKSQVMLLREGVILNLSKITEPRKQKLKLEILHDLKNF